jgi:hypothetical protein
VTPRCSARRGGRTRGPEVTVGAFRGSEIEVNPDSHHSLDPALPELAQRLAELSQPTHSTYGVGKVPSSSGSRGLRPGATSSR